MNFTQILGILRAHARLMFVTFLLTIVAAGALTIVMPSAYTATASVIIDFRGPDPLGSSSVPTQLVSSYLATQMDILSSERVALGVVEKLKLEDSEKAKADFAEAGSPGSLKRFIASGLLYGLTVTPGRDSRIVEIAFTAGDPEFAAKAANAFADSYIETNLELSISPARRGSDWLDTQLKVLRNKVSEAQERLTSYQRENNIVVTDDRLDTESSRLSTLTKQLVDLQASVADAAARSRQADLLMSQGELQAEALPEVLSNNFIQQLKTDLLRQQGKLEELSKQVGLNHPQYIAAKAEAEGLRSRLNTEIANVARGVKSNLRSIRDREAALLAEIEAQKRQILDLRQQRDAVSVLAKEAESAQRVYDATLQKFSEVQLQSQVNQTNVTILNDATAPVEPSRPNLKLNMALAFVVGLVLSFGLALVSELIDRRVRSIEDLQTQFGAPVLGVISKGVVPNSYLRG